MARRRESVNESKVSFTGEEKRFLDEAGEPAPDGGWGWFVVAASCLGQALQTVYPASFGITYVKIREIYDSSAATTSLIGAISSGLPYFLSHASTSLASRFSVSRIIFLGGLILGLAGTLSGFAPNVYFMIISFGVGTGIGGALIFSPGVVLVNQYFNRRRGIANGITAAGSGIGVFAAPPLMESLFNAYGFMGGLIVSGAIMLNNCCLAGLMRPLRRKKCNLVTNERDNDQRDTHEVVTENAQFLVDGVKPKEQSTNGSVCDVTQKNEAEATSLPTTEISNKSTLTIKRFLKHIGLINMIKPSFTLYCIGLSLVTQSSIASLQILVDFSKEIGIYEEKAVLLLSIIGALDTTGRVLIGFVFDINWFRRSRTFLYCGLGISQGVTILVTGTLVGYTSLASVCCLHGLIRGAIASQRASILVDLFGLENLPSCLGLSLACIGFGIFIGPVISGLLRDLLGIYLWSFVFNGVSCILGALILLSVIVHKHVTSPAIITK